MYYDFQDRADYISYGDDSDRMVFIRRCPICSRYVKANEEVRANEVIGLKDEPNAICKKHGAVKMPFLGFF